MTSAMILFPMSYSEVPGAGTAAQEFRGRTQFDSWPRPLPSPLCQPGGPLLNWSRKQTSFASRSQLSAAPPRRPLEAERTAALALPLRCPAPASASTSNALYPSVRLLVSPSPLDCHLLKGKDCAHSLGSTQDQDAGSGPGSTSIE